MKKTSVIQLISVYLRLSIGIVYLWEVADRLGVLGANGQPHVGWGDWGHFLSYAGKVMSFLPGRIVPALAVIASIGEAGFGLLLVIGFFTRVAAIGSGILSLCFAVSMAISFGVDSPFAYSVFALSAGSFMLATLPYYGWSLDSLLLKGWRAKGWRAKGPTLLVILAFATVFIVWGSTYFFIGVALRGFPPMLMGAIRFITAGLLMLGFCALKGDRLWNKKEIAHAAVSGLLMLFVAMGLVILAERNIPTAMVAIMISANPIWFVVLDRSNWALNLKNKITVYGLVIGFIGIILLFGEPLFKAVSGNIDHRIFFGFLMMIASPIAWSAGSLYSKKRSGPAPARLTTAWQMVIAGLAYLPGAAVHHEFASFHPSHVPQQAWLAMGYLIVFGSIAAFSAYIWLLKVRPATQVSMFAYVNPVIAVLLGVLFAGEKVSGFQLFGLTIILFSVLLVNLSRYGISMMHFGRPRVKIRPVCDKSF